LLFLLVREVRKMKPDQKTITLLREILAIPAPAGVKDIVAGMISATWPEVRVQADPDYWKRSEGGRKWFLEETLPEPLGQEAMRDG
jgi:hypothetical protein